MNEADLKKIERELDIRLPAVYRDYMASVSGEEFVGNSDCDIWDDAEAIIARNKELREGANMGGTTPWPASYYFIGDPLTACGNALDLSDPGTPVYWFDHCDINARSSGVVARDFTEWANAVVDSLN